MKTCNDHGVCNFHCKAVNLALSAFSVDRNSHSSYILTPALLACVNSRINSRYSRSDPTELGSFWWTWRFSSQWFLPMFCAISCVAPLVHWLSNRWLLARCCLSYLLYFGGDFDAVLRNSSSVKLEFCYNLLPSTRTTCVCVFKLLFFAFLPIDFLHVSLVF